MRFSICGARILGYIYTRIGDDNILSFNLWAFGNDNILIAQFVPLWNKLHGAQFFINEDISEALCVDSILKLWEA